MLVFGVLKKIINTCLHPFHINVVSRQLTLDGDYRAFWEFLVLQFSENGHWGLWRRKAALR